MRHTKCREVTGTHKINDGISPPNYSNACNISLLVSKVKQNLSHQFSNVSCWYNTVLKFSQICHDKCANILMKVVHLSTNKIYIVPYQLANEICSSTYRPMRAALLVWQCGGPDSSPSPPLCICRPQDLRTVHWDSQMWRAVTRSSGCI